MQMRAPGVVQRWEQRVEEMGVEGEGMYGAVGLLELGEDVMGIAGMGETSIVLVVRAIPISPEAAPRLVLVATEEVAAEGIDATGAASVEVALPLDPVPATSA